MGAGLDYIQGLQLFGMKLGLDNTIDLLERLGDPHRDFRSVHVAGTNGKGSTAAMLASILQAGGHKTGLYTSPHLARFNERVRVDGQDIPDDDLERLAKVVAEHCRDMENDGLQPTFFEATTALAFLHFAESNADFAVVEVGLGGRLDATNVLEPDLCIITSVGMEHADVLGGTVEEIAAEKVGIVKPGVPVITTNDGQALDVIRKRCRELHSPLTVISEDVEWTREPRGLDGQSISITTPNNRYEALRVPLIGPHQAVNAAAAITAAEMLDVGETSIRTGLELVRWRARMEVLSTAPPVILDSAHNPHGARALADALRELFPSARSVFCVGMKGGKDHRLFFHELAPVAKRFIITGSGGGEAANLSELERALGPGVPRGVVASPVDAVRTALSGAEGAPVVITGSQYFIGAVLPFLDGAFGADDGE